MKAIWAVAAVPEFNEFTVLQYSMLVASVTSFKKYHPEVTTILYVSPEYYRALCRMKVLVFWDEVYCYDFNQSGKSTMASWDYAKVEALLQEREKVFYVDYDIVFWGNVLKHLDLKKQYVFAEEPMKEALDSYLTKQECRQYGSTVNYKKTALNSGILYLNTSTVQKWNNIYRQEWPLILKGQGNWDIATRICLTVGQGGLGTLLKRKGNEHRIFAEDVPNHLYTHYLGWEKSQPQNPKYSVLLNEFKEKFGSIVKTVAGNYKVKILV